MFSCALIFFEINTLGHESGSIKQEASEPSVDHFKIVCAKHSDVSILVIRRSIYIILYLHHLTCCHKQIDGGRALWMATTCVFTEIKHFGAVNKQETPARITSQFCNCESETD